MEAVAELVAGRELDALVAEMVMGHGREGGVYWVQDPPAYSTDIAAAWQVADSWSITLSHATSLPWHCHLLRCVEGRWLKGDADAETAPLAICRAALAAVDHR